LPPLPPQNSCTARRAEQSKTGRSLFCYTADPNNQNKTTTAPDGNKTKHKKTEWLAVGLPTRQFFVLFLAVLQQSCSGSDTFCSVPM